MRVEFGQDDLDNVMMSLSAEEIDTLPFGAIQLDGAGKVLTYNATESAIAGRAKEAVIGRHFFNEIAPCCNTPGFRGLFDAGVKAGNLNALFDYVFDYRMNPIRVKIHMKAALADDTFWVFVRRL